VHYYRPLDFLDLKRTNRTQINRIIVRMALLTTYYKSLSQSRLDDLIKITQEAAAKYEARAAQEQLSPRGSAK
jgi:hypothetical protein